MIDSTQYAFLVCVWNAETAALFHHTMGLHSYQAVPWAACKEEVSKCHVDTHTYIWMDVNDTLHNTRNTHTHCGSKS